VRPSTTPGVEEGSVELIQVAQRAEDLDRAVGFYERLLGEPAVARFDPPGLVFFPLHGVRLLLERAAPSALLYLHVGDVRARVEALRGEGVEVLGEPNVIFVHADDTLGPAGTAEVQAFVRDSEGNMLGLVGFETREPPRDPRDDEQP
jgi:methylmalonyl-CoA/ethylmalonyl-CoA epimerase